ncbi:MAG TPA: hypothetical protein VFI41_05270 [Gemmatimonadales bacterium]|nr:hypothetical protein [Gemmatimonadales bacterium]
MDIDILYCELNRVTRQLRDLEARLGRVERTAEEAKDECYRLESRVRELEYAAR